MYSIRMRPGSSDWLTSPPRGRCTVCGEPLRFGGGRYWITDHPDGVHEACRAWEQEPFPFSEDLRELRGVARLLRHAWHQVLIEGRWLRRMRARWPTDARRVVGAWFVRKTRLQHHLSRVRERLGR
jgi:hypothetical protein